MNRSPFNPARALLLALAISLGACGDSSGPARSGPPASLAVVSGAAQQGQSGEPLGAPLVVKATDKDGRSVAKAIVVFTVTGGGGTLNATADTTDAEGIASVNWTMGPLLGTARVEARVTGVLAPAVFTATVAAGPATALERSSPLIGNSAAGFDVLDSITVVIKDRFGHPVANAPVNFMVTGGGGVVSHAARSTADDGTAQTAWRLGASGAQALRASSGGLETTITANAVACAESQMSIGDIATILPGSPSCMVLAGSAQRFLVTVVNTTRLAGSTAAFRFRGANPVPASIVAASTPSPAAPIQLGAYAAAIRQAEAELQSHSAVMRANAQVLETLGPARKLQRRQEALSARIMQAAPIPNLGDILPVRIPGFQNLCSVSLAAQIGARVAYVGTHAVILEDTLAPLRGQNDAAYQAVGQEFDNVMWPILTANFGNPLAYDAQLDNNGRLFMVFSPRLNTIQGGTIAGFVSSGDFFPTTGPPNQACAASNFGEYFYARVPNEAGSGFTSGNGTVTVDEWLRETRTVIIHEVKHITSYAEKFASPDLIPNGFFSSDQWLEESTAMAAEELWARTIFGYTFRGNTNYQSSIFCEVRPTNAACQPSKPVSMFDHYYWLSLFAVDPEIRSPVASPADDSSVYGSGWLFLRWALDQYAASEGAFLSALTKETQRPGVDNIEARTGRSFAELVSDWATAFALDDYPGFTPANQKHQVLSWNVRDIYSRLNADFSNQGIFLQAFPLKLRTATFGQFLINVSTVRGGGMSVFEISGTQAGKQLLEFKGSAGAEFPGELRINIARVQ